MLGSPKEARSLLAMGLYRPFKSLKQVKIPVLIVGATRDTVAPFVEDKIRAPNNPNIEIEKVDANHFEPCFEPAFSSNLGHQIAFLDALPGPEHVDVQPIPGDLAERS